MNLDKINRDGLVLLGCGKMGSALLQGWLAQGVKAGSVWVIEPHPTDWLTSTGVHLNSELPASPAIALIAVKPQMMGAALPTLANCAGRGTLILTVAAGTTIATYETVLGQNCRVVRAMPNTPAAVGHGITAICGNAHATEQDVTLAETLLSAVGQVVRLDGEHQMDAVTAVSGSGPGYVFHFIEALAAAGVAQGLPADLAMTLARGTVAGSGALAHVDPETAAQLRINVTSPGGTTAAGLAVLMPELTDLLTRTVAAAADRGRELGK